MSETTITPDASGTVVLSGHEELALAFDLKSSFNKKLEDELNTMKEQLRSLARFAIGQAAQGAVRVFFRNGQKGGVGVSLPDFSKPANRLVLSDKKMTEAAKLGELGSLGVSQEQLFEEEVTDVGGDVLELRGRWVQWVLPSLQQHIDAGDADIKYERRERTVTRRLRAEVLPMLRALAAQGSELAALLVDVGTKAMMVKPER